MREQVWPLTQSQVIVEHVWADATSKSVWSPYYEKDKQLIEKIQEAFYKNDTRFKACPTQWDWPSWNYGHSKYEESEMIW